MASASRAFTLGESALTRPLATLSPLDAEKRGLRSHFSGGTGSSFNVYDQPTKQWHQFWVDASGTNWVSSDKQGNPVTLRGGIRYGAMVMVSHHDTLPSIGLVRGTFRALSDRRVRQTF